MKTVNKLINAELVLVFVTMLWGGTFLAIKEALLYSSSFLLLFIRFLTAAVFMMILRPGIINNISIKTLYKASLLGFFLFIGYSMQTLGLNYTTINKSSFITYSFAVLVPPLQFMICRKKVKTGNLIGLFIVFTGLYLINRPEGSSINIGDVLTFIGAVSTAFFIIFLDLFSSKEDPYVMTFIQFIVISVLSLSFAVFFEKAYFNLNVKAVLSILYLALPGSVLAIFLMNKYQQKTSPVKAVILYSLEPVFATLFAFLFIREKITFLAFLGGSLILAGVIFSETVQFLSRKKAA